jgi:hypothetical protein
VRGSLLFLLALALALAPFGLAACSAGAPADPVTFDPCTPTTVSAAGATADQLASIDVALAAWRALGVRVTRAATGELPIAFRDGATVDYGLYDDTAGAIYINTDVTDPTARAITVAHELGHALGLVHVPLATRASVMNPGNLTISPTPADAGALALVWGACGSGA